MYENERRRACAAVKKLFKNGGAGTIQTEQEGVLSSPLPVLHDNGCVAAWFVPVLLHNRIVGYFLLLPDMKLLHYASLQRDLKTVDHCPAARDWIDHEIIRNRARTCAGKVATLDEPYLGYDGNVSRIAWVVRVTGADGKREQIYVNGEFVYKKGMEGGEVTG